MHPSSTLRPLLRISKRLQKSLSDNLDALETCSNHVRSKQIAFTILDLYEKVTHLGLVLEILERLNEELVVANRRASKTKNVEAKSSLLQKIKRLDRAMATIIKKNLPDKLDTLLEAPQPEVKVTRLPSPAMARSLGPSLSLPMQIRKSPVVKSVTIVTRLTIPEDEEIKCQEDESDVYWSTGHHTFLHFPDKEQYHVIQENDLSYQNLHLVAPANFVPPISADYISDSVLPWLTEQDVYKRNFDILREDLERVLRRTRKLQDKIWRAADLSVKVARSCNRDREEKKYSLSKDVERGTTAASMRTEATGTASSIRSSSLKSTYFSLGGELDFMAEPRPHPTGHQQLTRMNMQENFPHTCDRWTGAVPDPHSYIVEEAIANQGNLYSKTKLRLFVPGKKKKRALVKRDLITPDSIFSNRSFRGVASTIRFLNKLKSRGETGLSQQRKNRLEDLIKVGLKSNLVQDRIDAAKSLHDLGAADISSAAAALRCTVSYDPNSDVRFQASKALLILGFWPVDAIQEFFTRLSNGSPDLQIDVMESISSAPNIRNLFSDVRDSQEAARLTQELQQRAIQDVDNEKIPFLAAVCLVELCGLSDSESCDIALNTLKQVVLNTKDHDIRAHCLEVLVRRLDFCDDDTFQVILRNLKSAVKWKDRLAAALLIAHLGPEKLQEVIEEESMYRILLCKLWDDAKREVRLGVSQAITALGMRPRLLEDLDRSLRDGNEEVRTRAVISMSAAGIHTDATLRYLIEMLELDGSDYIRLQVMRTFHALNVTDLRVIRALKERERAGGPLSKAAQKFLSEIDERLVTPKALRRPENVSRDSRRMQSTRSMSLFRTETGNTTSRDFLSKSPQKSVFQDSESNSESTKRLSILSTAVRKSPIISSGTRLQTQRNNFGILRTPVL